MFVLFSIPYSFRLKNNCPVLSLNFNKIPFL